MLFNERDLEDYICNNIDNLKLDERIEKLYG